jgi:hypothetical protein
MPDLSTILSPMTGVERSQYRLLHYEPTYIQFLSRKGRGVLFVSKPEILLSDPDTCSTQCEGSKDVAPSQFSDIRSYGAVTERRDYPGDRHLVHHWGYLGRKSRPA